MVRMLGIGSRLGFNSRLGRCYFVTTGLVRWWSGSVGGVVDCVSEVNQHETWLVLGWVTIPVCNQPPRSTQPGHPSMGRRNEYQRKLGHKQAHRAMH